jgi:hypothetical protein
VSLSSARATLALSAAEAVEVLDETDGAVLLVGWRGSAFAR